MSLFTVLAVVASFSSFAYGAPTYALTRGYLSITSCVTDADCQATEACYFNRILPGSMSCYNKDVGNQKRAGSCPLPPTLSVFSGPQCTLHGDCSPGLRCCTTIVGTQVCVAATPAPAATKVTQLHSGFITFPPPEFAFEASTGLVQANGKNILFDAGNYQARSRVLAELRDQAGLYPEDIDMTITSHGHLDHYGVDNIFSKLPHLFNVFEITGPSYVLSVANMASNGCSRSDWVLVAGLGFYGRFAYYWLKWLLVVELVNCS